MENNNIELITASDAYIKSGKTIPLKIDMDDKFNKSIQSAKMHVKSEIDKAILSKQTSCHVNISACMYTLVRDYDVMIAITKWLEASKYKVSHPNWCDSFSDLNYMIISWEQ